MLVNYLQLAGCKYLISGDFYGINVAVVELKLKAHADLMQINVMIAVQAKLIFKPSV